jgi:hypothetical protein
MACYSHALPPTQFGNLNITASTTIGRRKRQVGSTRQRVFFLDYAPAHNPSLFPAV